MTDTVLRSNGERRLDHVFKLVTTICAPVATVFLIWQTTITISLDKKVAVAQQEREGLTAAVVRLERTIERWTDKLDRHVMNHEKKGD